MVNVVESKSQVFDYDIKIKYYPESDEAKFSYKTTPDTAGYDL